MTAIFILLHQVRQLLSLGSGSSSSSRAVGSQTHLTRKAVRWCLCQGALWNLKYFLYIPSSLAQLIATYLPLLCGVDVFKGYSKSGCSIRAEQASLQVVCLQCVLLGGLGLQFKLTVPNSPGNTKTCIRSQGILEQSALNNKLLNTIIPKTFWSSQESPGKSYKVLPCQTEPPAHV